ncbi:MAG: hypothetical protein ACLP1X_11250 [Polyangiaceae bacterium]|jgi:hypothetical protein
MSRAFVRHLSPFLALSVASVVACVWTDGNAQIVAPLVEDHILSVPPLPPPPIAWEARVAPTPEEVVELEFLRNAAREHRLASASMREAERAACSGLADDDRDVSAFFYREDIVDVQPLRAPDGQRPGRLEGAVVTFRRVEGLTATRLQRLMDCQIARDTVLGGFAPDARWCPLAVRSVAAHVVLAERGLDVWLTSADREAAAESYTRAVALLRTE